MKKKLSIIIGVIVLLALIAVGAFFFLKDDNKKENIKHTETIVPNIVLKDNGIPRFIDGSVVNTKVKNQKDVFKVLNELKDIYGFTEAEDTFEVVSVESSLDVTYYKVQQISKTSSYLSGTKVYGHQLVVAVTKDNKVASITGNYYPNIDIKTRTTIKEEDARAKIKSAYGEDVIIYSESGGIYDENKYIYIYKDNAIIAYILNILCSKGNFDVVIDASTGEIVDEISTSSNNVKYEYTGKDIFGVDRTITLEEEDGLLGNKYIFIDKERNIKIVDASNFGADVGNELDPKWINSIALAWKYYQSQDPITASMKDGVLAYDSSGTANIENSISAMYTLGVVYDYYNNVLGRKSFDNNGGEIVANIGISKNFMKHDEYYNASWNGNVKKFLFGSKDGKSLAAAIDIVGHEYTHAVVGHTAGLPNRGESGALNEGYADILGSLIEGENFQLGEKLEELRDMTDPNKHKNPAIKDGKYYFPTDGEYYNIQWRTDMMKKQEENKRPLNVWTDWDNGGVHVNSGVPNYAAYLMYKNGAFASKEEMAKVWYNSLFLLTTTSDFEDCALAVIQTAKTMGLSDDKIEIIQDAFVETKMLVLSKSTLTGKVVDSETNKPLEGVLVTVMTKENMYVNYETFTDANGQFTFVELPTTTYNVSYEKGKYETLEETVTLVSEKENKADASLKRIKEADYKKSEVVFVMDISASMTESDPEDARKQIMVNILSSMDKESSVALVVFTAKSKVINNGLSDKNVDKKILITDVFNIANDNGRNDESGTNGRVGLEEALKLFTDSKDSRKYIIFMTDGADNRDDGITYDEIIQISKDKNIRVLTIGLGSDKDLNPEQLEKIAEETNGKYYHATTSSDLHKYNKNIFEEID